MLRIFLWMLAIFSLLANKLALADDIKENQPHWYVDLGIGQSIDYRAGVGLYSSSGTVVIGASRPDYGTSPVYFQGEVGYLWNDPFTLGYNNPYFPFMSLGIQYRHTKSVTLETPFTVENVQFPQAFPYTIEQNSVLLAWKIDLYQWLGRIMPYLNFGLGASWNHTSQKAPTALAPDFITGSVSQNSDPKQNTDWNVNVGAGLEFIVATNFWLSLGYSYDSFGRLELGAVFFPGGDSSNLSSAVGQSKNIGNFHAHNIIFTARYLFG